MRLLVTGGTGVLGRALELVAEDAGHELAMPGTPSSISSTPARSPMP